MSKRDHDPQPDLPPAPPGRDALEPEDLDSPEAVERLQAAHEAMKCEIADLLAKYQRSLADFQNYQRRALANEREAREQGIRAVATGVLTALDHCDQALRLDPAASTPEQMLQGIQAIRDDLLKALAAFGIARIDPQPGEPFDANRHSAVARQPAPGVPPGAIVATMQAGYTLGDRTVRPAMVVVAPETGGAEAP